MQDQKINKSIPFTSVIKLCACRPPDSHDQHVRPYGSAVKPKLKYYLVTSREISLRIYRACFC